MEYKPGKLYHIKVSDIEDDEETKGILLPMVILFKYFQSMSDKDTIIFNIVMINYNGIDDQFFIESFEEVLQEDIAYPLDHIVSAEEITIKDLPLYLDYNKTELFEILIHGWI